MVSVPSREQSPSGIVVVVLALWFCLAVAVGYSGLLRNVAAPAISAIIAALTFLALLVCWQSPSLLGLEMRWLVGLHLTRFVGIYFILLARRGDIPRGWAVPAATRAREITSELISKRRLHRRRP
jgi:hypothetical protein